MITSSITTGDNGDDEAASESFVEDLVNLKGKEWHPSYICSQVEITLLPVLMDNFEEALDKIPLNELGQASKDGRYNLQYIL